MDLGVSLILVLFYHQQKTVFQNPYVVSTAFVSLRELQSILAPRVLGEVERSRSLSPQHTTRPISPQETSLDPRAL